MKRKQFNILIISFVIASAWSFTIPNAWIIENHKLYSLHYTKADLAWKNEYVNIIEKGIKSAETFFSSPFKMKFDIYIHPSRKSLDSQWQKDWEMPDFKSECWMVASGVAGRMDLLSPAKWDLEACEHSYKDKIETERLIAHELVHVYHGQFNSSPDFSDVDNIDWFVEGLATYASGQCDADRITEIKKALSNNEIPESLNDFWTGKYRYSLSGTMVMYIDKRYGRDKLKELLRFNKKKELFDLLKSSEINLLNEWKAYIQNLKLQKNHGSRGS